MVFTVFALPISEPELTEHEWKHDIIHVSQYLSIYMYVTLYNSR